MHLKVAKYKIIKQQNSKIIKQKRGIKTITRYKKGRKKEKRKKGKKEVCNNGIRNSDIKF